MEPLRPRWACRFYAGATWLAFRATARLARSRVVEFLAAQTVIIFVVHMPLYYVLHDLMSTWPRWMRAIPYVLLCYVGLAIVGDALYRLVRPADLRERLLRQWN